MRCASAWSPRYLVRLGICACRELTPVLRVCAGNRLSGLDLLAHFVQLHKPVPSHGPCRGPRKAHMHTSTHKKLPPLGGNHRKLLLVLRPSFQQCCGPHTCHSGNLQPPTQQGVECRTTISTLSLLGNLSNSTKRHKKNSCPSQWVGPTCHKSPWTMQLPYPPSWCAEGRGVKSA